MIRRFHSLAFLVMLLPPFAAAEELQDPTQPPREAAASGIPEPPEGGARVSLIRLNGSTALAMVDGRSVRAGDRLNGARVKSINAGGVTLEQDDRTWTLPLGSRPDMEIRRHP